MSKLVEFKGGYVAEIKYRYIQNIIDQAKKCKNITKIILFGSSIEDRCTEESDIDIAVFGEKTVGKYELSKEYKDFRSNIFSFDFDQEYDILYFKNTERNNSLLFQDIMRGLVIYEQG